MNNYAQNWIRLGSLGCGWPLLAKWVQEPFFEVSPASS